MSERETGSRDGIQTNAQAASVLESALNKLGYPLADALTSSDRETDIARADLRRVYAYLFKDSAVKIR